MIISFLLCNLKNNHQFLVNLNLSFTNVFEKREFRILFEKSLLVCDLIKNRVDIYSNKTKKLIFFKHYKFQRNKLFFDEIKNFKNSIKIKKKISYLSKIIKIHHNYLIY